MFPALPAKAAKGERIWITFRLLDGDSMPVPDAMIELWQADSEGNYKIGATRSMRSFQWLWTAWQPSEDGSCTFETIRPGRVPGPGNTLQAPHINVSVLGSGLLKRLSTRVYFADDLANSKDPYGPGAGEPPSDVVRPA